MLVAGIGTLDAGIGTLDTLGTNGGGTSWFFP